MCLRSSTPAYPAVPDLQEERPGVVECTKKVIAASATTPMVSLYIHGARCTARAETAGRSAFQPGRLTDSKVAFDAVGQPTHPFFQHALPVLDNAWVWN